jgi:diamine N-acetyltransferase
MKIEATNDYELLAKFSKTIHDLHVKLYPEEFKEYNLKAMKEFFKEKVDNPEFVFLLLEDDGQYVGYTFVEIKIQTESIFKKEKRSVYVHHLSVVGDQKRKGYGSELLNAIYNLARSNNIELVELDFWDDNDIAKNFYEKHGFNQRRSFVTKKI